MAADPANNFEYREHAIFATTGVFDADKVLKQVGAKTVLTSTSLVITTDPRKSEEFRAAGTFLPRKRDRKSVV